MGTRWSPVTFMAFTWCVNCHNWFSEHKSPRHKKGVAPKCGQRGVIDVLGDPVPF